MALKTAEPESPREDKIEERQAARFDPVAQRAKWEELRDHEDAIAARQGLSKAVNSDDVSIGDLEEQQGKEQQNTAGFKSTVTGRQETKKKKGPITVIITFVLATLGVGGIFLSFAVSPMAWLANSTLDLDDPLSAVEERADNIKGKKIRPGNATSFGCTRLGSALSVKCKYVTMSKKMVDRYKRAGIEITGEEKFGNRIKPTEFTFQGQTYTAQQFTDEVRRPSSGLGKAARHAQSMNFLSKGGPNFVNRTLGKWGLTKSPPAPEGDIDERLKTLANRTNGGSIDDGLQFVDAVDANGNPITDEQGRPLKRLAGDTDGDLWSQADIDKIGANTGRVKTINKPLLQGALALSALGAYDTTCSLIKAVGQASTAVKVANAAQLAEYAMPLASLSDSMKAGYIPDEDAQALQRFFNDTDARKTILGIVGEDTGEVPNPDYGKSAMDSELYKMSSNGGVAVTSVADARYSLGFGVNSLAKKADSFARVANAVANLGGVGACDIVQSWWARVGGFVAGIFLGAVSFTAFTGTNVAINAGLIVFSFFLDDILNAVLSNNLISETMDGAPVERGSAAWTGLAAIHSQHSLSRGMMPGTADQIARYQIEQNDARQEYIALERENSKLLDYKNPYSITGSLAVALNNQLPKGLSSSTLATFPSNISSFVFGGITSILKPGSANAASLDPERFKQCDDEGYKDIKIDADVQCNVRYVMPEESMQLDPLDVAQWMEDNDYVEDDTTTGMPEGYSPPDPADDQNIAMAIVMGQIDSVYNTRQYKNDYSKFLDFCVYRTLPFGETFDENGSFGDVGPEWKSGKKCMDTSDEKINYFRMYTFDRSVNDDLDESPIVSSLNCGPLGSNSGGASGPKMSQSQLEQLIPTYGLPSPQAEATPGQQVYGEQVKGYEELLQHLKENPKAAWAAQAMLNGERTWKAAGGDVKEYLNTAWLWFESGQGAWPDPYLMNCDDEKPASIATRFCPVNNFQSAGYQGAARKNDYVEVFNKLYEESELSSIMENVVKNSSNASKDQWDYNNSANTDKSQYFTDFSGVTLNDIAPNKDFLDEKTQILTLILGKDPNMSAALNTFAVSDADLVQALKGSGYGYIGTAEKQLIANMMMALYMFDGSGPASGSGNGGDCSSSSSDKSFGGGAGIEAVWGGVGEKDLSYGFGAQGVAAWYGYGTNFGTNGTTHTGTDIPMNPYDPVYSPVAGVVVCERTGVGQAIPGVGCAGAGDYSGTTTYGDCVTGYDPSKPRGAGTVMIKMDNGDAVVLGHLSESKVKLGDKVKPNQQIGAAGCMNGWHTHVEYYTPAPGETPSGLRLLDPVTALRRGEGPTDVDV